MVLHITIPHPNCHILQLRAVEYHLFPYTKVLNNNIIKQLQQFLSSLWIPQMILVYCSMIGLCSKIKISCLWWIQIAFLLKTIHLIKWMIDCSLRIGLYDMSFILIRFWLLRFLFETVDEWNMGYGMNDYWIIIFKNWTISNDKQTL